jgi:hypothetical protein
MRSWDGPLAAPWQTMTRRNSSNDIQDLGDLSRHGDEVVDKRLGQRASAKKNDDRGVDGGVSASTLFRLLRP